MTEHTWLHVCLSKTGVYFDLNSYILVHHQCYSQNLECKTQEYTIQEVIDNNLMQSLLINDYY
jgi:hypothetical protein